MGLGASDLLLAFAPILLFHKGQIAEKLPLYCIGLSYCTLFFSISFNSLPATFSCWTCYQLERNLWLKWFPWKGYNRLLNPGYSDPCWMFSKPLRNILVFLLLEYFELCLKRKTFLTINLFIIFLILLPQWTNIFLR